MERVASVPVAVSPDSGLYTYGHSVQPNLQSEQPFTPTQQVTGALAALGISVVVAITLSVAWVKVMDRR